MSEPQTIMAYRLICDFARGPAGDLQGLTAAEMRRAWVARHGGSLSRRAADRLRAEGLVKPMRARLCTVTGRFVCSYVPTFDLERQPC